MRKRSKVVILMALLAMVSVLTSPPSQSLASVGICGAAFCSTASHCWNNCPSASSVACVNNVCQYTYPGSSGPGSGGGQCPYQKFCNPEFNDCDYGSVQGSCVNSVCVC